MHSYAFVCICMHSHAFSCTHLGQEHPAQLGKLRGVLGRAAHLGRQLVDGLRRDGAVLVAQVGVLLLLEGVHGLDLVHGLAARDDDRVEFIEQLIIHVRSSTIVRKSGVFPPKCTGIYRIMHMNASQVECSTFKMHQSENVLECVKMRHVYNAT
jgi:hypothetical protein